MAYEFKGPTIITKNLGGSKDYFFIVRYDHGKEEYLSVGMNRQPKWVTNFNFASTYADAKSAQKAYDLLMKDYKESNEKMISKVNEANAFDTYLQDVHATKEYQAYLKEFSKLGYVKLYTLKNGSEIEVNIQPNLFAKDDFHPEINYNVYKKTLTIQTSSYGPMDLSKHQMFIDHVNDGHNAAKLLLKLMNDKNYWNAIPDISTYKENRLSVKKDVVIEKDIRIPGTNIVLETGDKIKYVSSVEESASLSELNNIASGLQAYLKKNKEFYSVYPDVKNSAVCIDVEWGDWKHDHLYVDSVVAKYFDSIGVDYMTDEKVTDEDGSDTYSSTHIYHMI